MNEITVEQQKEKQNQKINDFLRHIKSIKKRSIVLHEMVTSDRRLLI